MFSKKNMQKVWGVLKNYIQILKESQTFKGDIAILIYFFKIPLRLFYKVIGKEIKHSLIWDVTIKNNDGVFFCGKNIFSVRTASSEYEALIKKYFDLKKGVFIDVGANIGKYTILVGRRISGKVIAIEPEKRNFEVLKRNVELNKLNNVVLIDNACSSKNEIRKFFLDRIGSGTHSFYKTKIRGSIKGFIHINTERLDKIIKKNLTNNEIKKISLIKIDVEGAEADVLKGAIKTLKKSHPKIIFEAWDEQYLKKIKEVLKPFNYKIKQITPENYIAY